MPLGIARRAPYGVRLPYLRAWREHRMLTQGGLEAASRDAGEPVSRVTIMRLEGGSVARYTTVKALADALGITSEQLCREAPTGGAA